MAVTIMDLAIHMGAAESPDGSMSAEEFDKLGLPFIGGCEVCEATIAAYNAYPGRNGYIRCRDCIGNQGWDDPAEAQAVIFATN